MQLCGYWHVVNGDIRLQCTPLPFSVTMLFNVLLKTHLARMIVYIKDTPTHTKERLCNDLDLCLFGC